MDEFETRILQERIKTCSGRLTVDEYYKYCTEINNTYTAQGIKGSKLCQLLFKKRPKAYTTNSSTPNVEHYVRKKV